MAVLRDLIDVRAALNADGLQVPEALHLAIDAMAPFLRLLQHGDGGLALFNDGSEEDGWRVDMVLQRAGGGKRPLMDAPQGGFQRLQAGRTILLIDAGEPPPPGYDASLFESVGIGPALRPLETDIVGGLADIL